MAVTSYNDSRETLRQSYGGVFETLYTLRRNIHYYVLGLAIIVVVAPALWWLTIPLMLFLYVVDTDRQVRMQDRFGRGRGPYLKKKAGTKYGQIEEWSVVSTPQHRGGDGIWPLGNNIHTQEEVWCSDDYVRTHAVLSGTTGSGKTVTMSSTFIFVALVSDSGVIMIDGKADPKTWFDLYAMAVAAGRADDFLVLNFVVGASQEAEFSFSSGAEKELWEEFQSIESNTFNIFGTGTADTLFEIGSGLLGDEASGDNKMWVERAQALLRSMLKALVDLRDLGQIKISIATLQEYMNLDKLSELENNPDISNIGRQQIGAVLNEIAGYRDAMKVDDPQRRAALLADQPSKQFAFLHMQFGALYAMLIGTYGHIANVEYSDIYTPDIIRSRRILLVMLPALEKAPTSLAQLGRMATSAIKSALAQNISGSLTGRKSELVDRRPTNSIRAMVLIYDEAASYIQAGTADVASQSRSLGAFNIFSSQEWSSFKNAGEIEATRLISNSGLKIVLKNEDKETADHFMNAVGDAPVLKSAGKRWEKGKLIESERRLESVPRVTFQEMMNLAEGQAFVKWRDTMIQIRMPYVSVKAVTKAQRNDLVPIPGSMPNDRVRMRQQSAIARDVEETKLPPLNLIEALTACLEEETDQEESGAYPLFEVITRALYKKQIVIPWESAPPPRGKVEVRCIYKFKAETMAADLMWALERTEDTRLTPVKTLPTAPEHRFVIPFLPHEDGLIDTTHADRSSLLDASEETDQAIESTDEAIAAKLEERQARSETGLEDGLVADDPSDELTDLDEAIGSGDDDELSEDDLIDSDGIGDLADLLGDGDNSDDPSDLTAFLGVNDADESEDPGTAEEQLSSDDTLISSGGDNQASGAEVIGVDMEDADLDEESSLGGMPEGSGREPDEPGSRDTDDNQESDAQKIIQASPFGTSKDSDAADGDGPAPYGPMEAAMLKFDLSTGDRSPGDDEAPTEDTIESDEDQTDFIDDDSPTEVEPDSLEEAVLDGDTTDDFLEESVDDLANEASGSHETPGKEEAPADEIQGAIDEAQENNDEVSLASAAEIAAKAPSGEEPEGMAPAPSVMPPKRLLLRERATPPKPAPKSGSTNETSATREPAETQEHSRGVSPLRKWKSTQLSPRRPLNAPKDEEASSDG